MPFNKEIGPLRLKHLFAVSGFVATATAIIVLTIFYRDMIVKDIVMQGERQNQLLAQTALNSVRHELIEYLQAVDSEKLFDPEKFKRFPNLKKALQDTLSNNYVTRIHIYKKDGTLVYSTAAGDKDNDADETGFAAAIAGKTSSNLALDDLFNFFSKSTEVDNLVETYLPVRESEDSPILGVFEIYTDVGSIVSEVRRTEMTIIFGIAVVLLVLYGLLVFIVSRAANTIGNQQAVIRERTHTLELLSSQLIKAQEDEKRQIAHDLHENIAQSLAGIKNVVESTLSKQAEHDGADVSVIKQSIKALQSSIGEIRSLAMDLRPPSLDDFGLIKTLDWLCREYQVWFPDMKIQTDFTVEESGLSDELKTIVYRVAQEALDRLSRLDAKLDIKICLGRQAGEFSLTVETTSEANSTASQKELIQDALSVMKQRTMLSGGNFSIRVSDTHDGLIAQANWISA